jgi:hypothetical protein
MRRKYVSIRLGLAIVFTPALLLGQVNIRQALLSQRLDVTGVRHVDLRLEPQTRSFKSVGLAVLYSVVLPGMGDLYADNFSTGKYYLMGDAGLWLTYAGFRLEATWVRQDAQSFATQHSSASFAGKGSQFAVDLGNYLNVDAYNEAKLRNGEYDRLYDPQSTFAWSWDSDASRLTYKSHRTRSDEIVRNSEFLLGALALNRILAAFSAWRATVDYNRRVTQESNFDVGVRVTGMATGSPGVELTLRKTF